MSERLQAAAESKRVLVIGVSHLGGHKWAGLMQVRHAKDPHQMRLIICAHTVARADIYASRDRGVLWTRYNARYPGHCQEHDPTT